MGLFRHSRATTPPSVWLPGTVEVQVVGEAYHTDAIRKAEKSTPSGQAPIAELIPQPDNPCDDNAVAVYVNGFHVGYLSRQIVPVVQPALIAFAATNGGRRVSCPARIHWHGFRDQLVAQVVLNLDPAPLRLPPSAFDYMPELDQVIQQQFPVLDLAAPALMGIDPAARTQLAAAEEQWEAVEASYDRLPGAWPLVEQAFVEAARLLEQARDPRVSAAWAGVAKASRYQKGKDKRDDRIKAAAKAIYWDRTNQDAWSDLFDLAAAAPHIPTLLELFRRVPLESRPPIVSQLLALSYGHDRLGNMHAEAGERLRDELLKLAQAEGDLSSVKKIRRWINRRKPSNGRATASGP